MILTIWLDQNKLNNQHPIRSDLRNQSEITKISPRGDGFFEEFGKEVEPRSCLEEVLENAFENTFEDLAKKLDTLSKL